MTRLTAAQKAANKAARLVRDREFSARRKKYRAERVAAEMSADGSAFAIEAEVAAHALDAELARRDEDVRQIEKQIAALKAKTEAVKSQYRDSIEIKNEARRAAFERYSMHKQALLAQVKARFPDMEGCYSASGWQIPADVRANMEIAAANSLKDEAE